MNLRLINVRFLGMTIALLTVIVLAGSSCSERLRCYKFKVGTFKYADETRKENITRTENMQIEINPETGVEIHTSVSWLNDCAYIMTYDKILNHPEDMTDMIGNQLVVNIIETKGDKLKVHVKGGPIDEEVDLIKTD